MPEDDDPVLSDVQRYTQKDDHTGTLLRDAAAGDKQAEHDLLEWFEWDVRLGGAVDARLIEFVGRKIGRILDGGDPRKVFPKPTKTGRPNNDDERLELAALVAEHMLGEPIKPESLNDFNRDNRTRGDKSELDAIAA